MKKIFTAILVFCFFGIAAADQTSDQIATIKQGCSANGLDFDKVVSFQNQLQTAIKNQDKTAVSNMVAYPLRINYPVSKSASLTVANKNKLMKNYNKIFSPSLTQAIATTDTSQLFCNYQGAMIAGVLWAKDFNGQLKIFVINSLDKSSAHFDQKK